MGGVVDARTDTRGREQDFNTACTTFKNFMHVSSFVYDFHLRYFQSFLADRADQFPALDYVQIVQGV